MSNFKKLGVDVSLMGFGCMRLPTKSDGKVDREHAAEMLDYALKNGINYLDTAYGYHGGESEEFLGEALKKYDRDSYYLATKLPIWMINSLEDARKVIEFQMSRLQVDRVDFLLVHAVNKERYEKCKELGILSFLEELKKEGKIKYIGFSFHGITSSFAEIVDGYDWDFVQIQMNYVDYNMLDSKYLYEVLKERDIPAVIMEPVRGGFLSKLPEEAAKLLKEYAPEKSETSWALRWLMGFDNAKLILSGASSLEHMKENIETFSNASALNEEEAKIIDKVCDKMREIRTVPCTSCAYCMPCPVGVNIPRTFEIYNTLKLYGNVWRAFNEYHVYFNKEEKPSYCISCKKCEENCPQKIEIVESLKMCNDELDPLKEQFKNDPRCRTSV